MTGNIFPKVPFLFVFITSCKSKLKWKLNGLCMWDPNFSVIFLRPFSGPWSSWINLLSQHRFEQYLGMNKIIMSKPVCYHIQNAFNVYPVLCIFILHCNLKDRSSFCLAQRGCVYYPELCKFQLFFTDISVTLL